MKKSIIQHAIALDLVLIATGITLLIPQETLVVLAIFLGAVLAAAVAGGRAPGTTALVSSLVVLGFAFGGSLRPDQYVLFSATGVLLSLFVPAVLHRQRAAKAAAPSPVTSPALPRTVKVEVQGPRWMVVATAAVVMLVYTDVSEALITTIGVPSLLQPIIVGLAFVIWFHRDRLQPTRVLFHPISLILVCYTALLFVSSLWADDPALSDDMVAKTVKNLLIYGVVAILASQWRALKIALATLTGSAAVLALMSLTQIATNTRNEFGGLATLAHGNIYGDEADLRAAGPIGDANFYAQILVIVVPIALGLAYRATRAWQRIAWFAAAVVITGGILVTYSRGAMLALALMTAMILVALRVPLHRVAIGTAIALMLLVLTPGNVGRRVATMVSLIPQDTYYAAPDSSIERRKLIAASGLDMFSDHSVLGVGAGNFGTFYPHYSRENGSSADLFYEHGEMHLEHAHSLYLELAAENGVLGLGIFAALLLASYGTLRRARRIGVANGRARDAALILALSLGLSGFLATSAFLHSGSQRYFFLLLALITAAGTLGLRRDDPAATEATGR